MFGLNLHNLYGMLNCIHLQHVWKGELPIFALFVPLQIVFLEKSFDEQINESDSQPFESETQVRNLLKCWTFF